MEEDREGIIDDIGTLVEWRPILGLVRDVQKASTIPDKADAMKNLLAFVLKTGFQKDPYHMRAFLLVVLACQTLRQDKQWQRVVADLLK